MMIDGRSGIFALIWRVRLWLRSFGADPNPAHHGSDNLRDWFGLAPYNDNDVKRERRDGARFLLLMLGHQDLIAEFDQADAAKGWRDRGDGVSAA